MGSILGQECPSHPRVGRVRRKRKAGEFLLLSPMCCPSLSPRGTRQSWDERGSVILREHLPCSLCCLCPCPGRMSVALPPGRSSRGGDGSTASHGVGDEGQAIQNHPEPSRTIPWVTPEAEPEVRKSRKDPTNICIPAANQELLAVDPQGAGSQLLVLLLSSKSHPVESSWIQAHPESPENLEQGGARRWWPPQDLGAPVEEAKAASSVELVRDWKPFPPPQNTDSPERGWKVPCFRSNQHFFVQGAARTPRALPPKGAPHLPALCQGGSCPVGWQEAGGLLPSSS